MKLREYKHSVITGKNIDFIIVNDVIDASHFYKAAFGFKYQNKSRLNVKTVTNARISMTLENVFIVLLKGVSKDEKLIYSDIYQENLPYKKKIIIHLNDKNINRLYLKAVANSAISIQEPTYNEDGMHYCVLQDYHGYRWLFINNESL